jgi:hypothetical protein
LTAAPVIPKFLRDYDDVFGCSKTKSPRRFFCPGRFVVAGVNRLVLAVADGADAHRVNAQLGQRLAGGQRAAFAERAVVFLRAALVAIALDEQLRARVGTQRAGNGLQIRLLAVTNDRAVVGKMNCVGRQRSRVRNHVANIQPVEVAMGPGCVPTPLSGGNVPPDKVPLPVSLPTMPGFCPGSAVSPTGLWLRQPVEASVIASANASVQISFIVFIFFLRLILVKS